MKIFTKAGRISGSEVINFGSIILFVGLMGAMMLLMPRMMDDIWFLFQLRPWYEAQGMSFPDRAGDIFGTPGVVDGIRQIWLDHYYTDNIRFGNILAPILLVLPLWIGKSLSILILFYILYGMSAIAGFDIRRSPLCILMLALLGFVLTWNENLVVLDYQLNYIWSSGITIYLLRCLGIGSSSELKKRKSGIWRLTGIFVLGILCGGWHEGFGAPVLAAMAIMSIFYGTWRTRNFLIAEAGLLIGLLYLTLSPGMIRRIEADVNSAFTLGIGLNYAIMCGTWVISILLIIVAYRCRLKEFFKGDKLSVFLVLTCFVSFMISVRVNAPGRASWWGRLMSVTLLMHVLIRNWPSYWSTYRKCGLKWVSGVAMLLCVIRFGYGVAYCIEYRKSYPVYMQEYERHPSGTVFGKVWEPRFLSPLAFYMPYSWFPNDAFLWIGPYTLKVKEGRPAFCGVVPEELRCVTSTSGTAIPGGSNIRELDGYLFMPWNEEDASHILAMQVDYGAGYKEKYAHPYEFVSEADGQRYVYVQVFGNWFDYYLGELRRIAPGYGYAGRVPAWKEEIVFYPVSK